MGQLGDGARISRGSPERAGQLVEIDSLSSFAGHTCAVGKNGMIYCWGANGNGQLGDGTEKDKIGPVCPAGLTDVSQVSVGRYHTCALKEDGEVLCWGRNSDGQLGDGTNLDHSKPLEGTAALTGASAVSAGETHTCALREDGQVLCWGAGKHGQLGQGNSSSSYQPLEVTGLDDVVSIQAAWNFTCALRQDDDSVWCWGLNQFGQLGDGTTTGRSLPGPVLGLGEVIALSSGRSHSCVLTEGGEVWCWGTSTFGSLGNADWWSNVPVPVL